MINILSKSNILVDPLKEFIENRGQIDIITQKANENTVVEKLVKKGTDTFLNSISNWFKGIFMTTLDYLGGFCFIVGSVAVLGMMVDTDNNLGCKKYVLGSILIYIGIQCIKIIIE